MLSFILSAYNSLYLLTLNFHSIPLSPTLPTGNHRSVLVSGSLFLFVQFSSVAQSCLTLCDPVDCSMPGLPVHHQTPEFTQTHAHRVGDAIQPSHPLSSSSPATSLSQHKGLFKCQLFTSGGQSIGVSASASVLPMNIKD